MVQGDGIGHLGADALADGVEHEARGLLEAVVPGAERGVHDPRQHGHQLLLLLGEHVALEVLAEDAREIAQGVVQIVQGLGLGGGVRRFRFRL